MTTKFAVSLAVVAVCLLSLSVAISVPPGKYAAVSQFRDFMIKYNKNYPAEEMKQRFAIFSQNLKKIDEMNAKSTSATFAVNKFADLSAEEFKRYYTGTKVVRDPNWETLPNLPDEVLQAIPDSFDWVSKGAVTGVKDQGQCGSCWSFSTTGNVEGQWFLAGNDLVGLSEQNLVDCDHFCMEYQGEEACDAGCDGGLMPNAFRYIIASGGINTEADYPYDAYQNTACEQNNKTLTGKIDDWKMIPSDEDQMRAYLAQTGPLSVAVDADAWQFYFGGVLQISIFCGTSLDHGVLIVGYGNETNIIGETVQFWNIKNSWGADWGESGYIRIERGEDECGVDLFPCTSLINKRK